jgi:peptide-methionine (S)-S-oxide reductase
LTHLTDTFILFFFFILFNNHSAEDYHQQYLAKPGANPYCSAQPLEISMPPVTTYAPDSGLENKLPEKYWDKHAPTPHCVLRVSNEQISLSSL